MVSHHEKLVQALQTTMTDHEFFEKIKSIANDMGFDYCAYGMRIPLPVSNPKVYMFNNYPSCWQEIYRSNHYLNTDPTVHHCLHSPLSLIWSEDLFSGTQAMWEEARSFGLNVGWAQSCRTADGLVGMTTLARDSEPISKAELHKKEADMIWLNHIMHIGMSRRFGTRLLAEDRAKLTPREIEVLRWTADGKTSNEVSMILNIAERTVNFHIANVITKFQVVNKTAAVIYAALMGVLY